MHEQDGYKHLQVKDSARDLSPTAQEALVFVVVAPAPRSLEILELLQLR